MTTITLPTTATALDQLVLAGTRAIERAVTRRMVRRAASAGRLAFRVAADERARDVAAVMHTGIPPR